MPLRASRERIVGSLSSYLLSFKSLAWLNAGVVARAKPPAFLLSNKHNQDLQQGKPRLKSFLLVQMCVYEAGGLGFLPISKRLPVVPRRLLGSR